MKALARACAAAALAVLTACGGGYAPASPPPLQGFAYVTGLSPGGVSVHPLGGEAGTLNGARSTAPSGPSPLALAAHPSGRFLYVANFLSSDLSAFAIDGIAGTLAPIGERVGTGEGFNPIAIAVHPSGRFAYVTTLLNNPSTALVLPFAIDATTGALTKTGTGAFAGAAPSAIAISPGGKFAYVTDPVSEAVWTFAIDTDSGAVRNLNPDAPQFAGFGPVSVAIDGSGRFVYVASLRSNSVSAFAADPVSGTLTPIGEAIAAGAQPASVAVHPTNRFVYVANAASDDISMYRADGVTGALSPIGSVPAGDLPKSIAFDASGKLAFVANHASDDISVYSVDAASGVLSPARQPVPTGGQPTAIVVVGGPARMAP